MLQHFVVTRLGIGVRDEHWYDSTLGLFEAITFPSLCAQTCADFQSLVIVDSEMPEGARSRLAGIITGHPNFHVVPIDLAAMQHVRQGCFDYVWERCQDYLLAERIIVDPFEYIISSVLDGDDAWHHQTIQLVHDRTKAEMPEFLAAERRGMTWIRHTGGMCLTFPQGLQWFAHPDIVVPIHYPFLSMSVFVAARFSSGISACSSRHSQWPSYCNLVNFKPIICESNWPMWVYVRHDRSEVPWDAQNLRSDAAAIDVLQREFAINFDKVSEWRENPELRSAASAGKNPISHAGMAGTEQLDCYFRITALNRQIAALEHKPDRTDRDNLLLAKQRVARQSLLQIFRAAARSIFS